ncbi:hypothetical protein FACS189419_00360 [Planctomycetales bacterium]|nr:hypothetical protein FACS189419_00360 [Planctomycetales bacterium]
MQQMKQTLLGLVLLFLPLLSVSFAQSTENQPAKLIPQQIPRSNPLRDTPAQRLPVTNPIRQAALETESTPEMTSFDNFPAANPSEDVPNSFDVSNTAPRTAPAFEDAPAVNSLPKPQPKHQPEPVSALGNSLESADPFAGTQPAAAVPQGKIKSLESAPQRQIPELRSREPQKIDSLSPQQTTGLVREGTGSPGAANLEGPQNSQITIQKVFPQEVLVEQPVTIKTLIHNVGKATARKVTVTDRVPKGCKLLSTTPEAAVTERGELHWTLGNLDPNDQIILETKILPLREGEIGSVAFINYTGEASARVEVTRPMIKVDVKAPQEVQLGQVANIEITISNPGSATATGIVLEEHVPDGLYHKLGQVIRNEVSVQTLKPKEAKKLLLPLTCTGAGNLVNRVVVKADGNLVVEEKTTIRASAPVLNLQILGAKQRFLDLNSDYKLVVANTGNASARNIDLELALPPAVKFVKTNQSGAYDAATHTVRWALEELPAQESGEIELEIVPTQSGQQTLKFTGKGQNNLHAEAVLPLVIDGIPALAFETVGGSNLVEAGKDAVYEIRVINKGTKVASNVKVRANLADGLSFIKAEGGRYQANGGIVQFETLPQLEPKSEKTYKIVAKCPNEGDYRVSVQIISDDLRSSVGKEESIRVFR